MGFEQMPKFGINLKGFSKRVENRQAELACFGRRLRLLPKM